MKLYKLTDQNDRTHGGCQWGENVTVEADGGGYVCGPGFTHWCTDPLLAVLLNPIHGNFDLGTAHLWEGEGDVVADNHGLKVGCTKATTLRRIPLPVVTAEQRVRFAILCAMQVCGGFAWRIWARSWLDGTERSSRWAASAATEMDMMTPGADGYTAARLAAEAARELEDGVTEMAAARFKSGVARLKMSGLSSGLAALWSARISPLDLIKLAKEAIAEGAT